MIYFHFLCFGLFLPCLFALFFQVNYSSVMGVQNVLCQHSGYKVDEIKQNCPEAIKKEIDKSSVCQNKNLNVSLNDN